MIRPSDRSGAAIAEHVPSMSDSAMNSGAERGSVE